MSVKILHTADIHLDSPFAAFSPTAAEKRREIIRQSFLALIEKAREEKVQLFFISGDLFDTEFATRDTALMLKNAFASLSSCLFFISPGNHDPFTANSVYATAEFPDNVHVFRERQCIELADMGVRVYGFGFTSSLCGESTVSGYDIPDDGMINILVCHGDMSGALSSNGPVTKADVGGSGFDYVALGHIHKATGVRNENGVYYAYPGCLCGRSFDETGKKSALIGTVEKGKVCLDEVSVAGMRYEIIHCDVTDSLSRRNALDMLREAANEFDPSTVVRIIAEGDTSEEYLFSPDELAGQTKCETYIVDNTRPVISFTGTESENTLKGVFYRIMEKRISEAKAGSEEYNTLVKALKYGLAVLDEKNIADIWEDEK